MVDSKPLFTGEEWDDIYGMPPNALKVWLFHYRCEIDGRESWPGEDLICYKLRICRDTLADNRKWLRDHGWLVQLTEAYPGHNPTFRVERGTLPLRGSKKKQAKPLGDAPTVESYSNHSENSVDEPIASENYRRDELPSQRKKADANNASEKMRRKNTDAKVYGSSSVSVSSSVSSSPSVQVRGDLSLRVPCATAGKDERKAKTQTENQKPKTRRVAKDGSPVPLDIDSWSLEKKLAWSQEHNGTGARMSARPNKEETPKTKPQPQGVTRTGSGHFCDGDSIECENSAYNQLGNRWLCDSCQAAELAEL
jgi:hypothetical protein